MVLADLVVGGPHHVKDFQGQEKENDDIRNQLMHSYIEFYQISSTYYVSWKTKDFYCRFKDHKDKQNILILVSELHE